MPCVCTHSRPRGAIVGHREAESGEEDSTIDTLELPGTAGVVELGAVKHVPHAVGLLVVLAAVGGIQALHKLVFFPSLGAGEDITTLTVALTNLEESTLEKMIKLEIFKTFFCFSFLFRVTPRNHILITPPIIFIYTTTCLRP